MVVDREVFLRFCDEALDQMAASVRALGDDLVNERPPVPGANSAYGLVTHCLGVIRVWVTQANLGVPIVRDRDAEFLATGTVADLLAAIETGREGLHADVRRGDPSAPPALPRTDSERWYQDTQGGVLMHVYEELAQHCGHLDVTRDLLLAGRATTRRSRRGTGSERST